MALKKGNEIPTIDVALVTIITANNASEIALDTASKIAVSVETETKDGVKLVIKNALRAQKPAEVTITGNTIILTDNVFNPEVAKILQGGTITYNASNNNSITGYTPPVAGSTEKGEVFELSAYAAIYSAAGLVTGYEKITYPNCKGTPFGISSEDGVFRVSEYTINSAPNVGQSPYSIGYVANLPTVG
jgi:hypothetical protein